jgi:hypothetical protein
LYPFHGFNLITDLNVHTTAQLALNPNLDMQETTENWIKSRFGNDPIMVAGLSEVLLSSFEVMKQGLYISEFAKKEVRALGLEPPPMLWIFEWDIVTASNAVLSYVFYISGDQAGKMAAEGREAVTGVHAMQAKALGVQDRVQKNHQEFDLLLSAFDYQVDLFEVLASYREYFLNYYAWIASGDAAAYQAWKENLEAFRKQSMHHTRQYEKNLDFPAFSFTEANIGARLAENAMLSRNTAALAAIALLALIMVGLLVKSSPAWKNAIRLLIGTLVLPFRQAHPTDSPEAPLWPPVLVLLLTIILGTPSLTAFAAPVTTLTVYGFLVTYLLLLYILLGRQNPAALVSILSPPMLLFLVYLLVSGIRGPGLLWYYFWTSETFRMVMTLISALLLLWVYVVQYAVARKVFLQTRTAAIATLLIVQGTQLILLGGLTHWATLERSLTAVNDELAILPGGLSRIMGITTHLDIPTDIPVHLLVIGLVLAGSGLVVRILFRRTPVR